MYMYISVLDDTFSRKIRASDCLRPHQGSLLWLDVEIFGDTLKNIITAGLRPASKASGWPASGKPPLATWMTWKSSGGHPQGRHHRWLEASLQGLGVANIREASFGYMDIT